MMKMKLGKYLVLLVALFMVGCQENQCDELRTYDEIEYYYTQRTDGSYQVNIMNTDFGIMGYCQCYDLKNEKDSIFKARLDEAQLLNPGLYEVMLRNPNEYNCF